MISIVGIEAHGFKRKCKGKEKKSDATHMYQGPENARALAITVPMYP